MTLPRLAVAASAAALTLGASQLAHAQDPSTPNRAPIPEPSSSSEGLPVQYVERPLTLPEMTLAPEFGASLTHIEFGVLQVQSTSSTSQASCPSCCDLAISFGSTRASRCPGSSR